MQRLASARAEQWRGARGLWQGLISRELGGEESEMANLCWRVASRRERTLIPLHLVALQMGEGEQRTRVMGAAERRDMLVQPETCCILRPRVLSCATVSASACRCRGQHRK